ncbi:16S rRNA m(4)C1402 methyltransferase [Gracilibacillus halophilus YIM-C55.5]|uniref:Ribosomal RNA small subunit methyltransferase H n=1 Tax=Gracilibacillus halophilus YIM-C55.5 TaxID=1308866 RepID=N4WZ69_9BACI|nr:16S rRNA (cytosine(1402)-N(4))-methyltransferase RsmH [Gracilibacillus halophilus]ENH98336.1 16S rRNA m(4)C1402 methyltransferase [Gracilibacillus halophilus YIM-C55.5]
MFDHETVLKQEAVDGLNLRSDGTYIDCTLGGGGHAEAIIAQLDSSGELIAFDQDEVALQAAEKRLKGYQTEPILIKRNFRYLKEELAKRSIDKVDGILFDLGVSSPQLDQPERGFSYQHDAPLDMRMNQNSSLTAATVVNEWSYQQLVFIFTKYGEEKFSKQIARKIEAKRKQQLITTTFELVDVIKEAIPAPARRKGGHPAKRIFQALRIAVNDELQAFQEALDQAGEIIGRHGRIAVISFHSLEDRICKQTFKKWSTPPPLPKQIPVIPDEYQPPFQFINKKPIIPGEIETEHNRRSRSAKLRIVERIAE